MALVVGLALAGCSGKVSTGARHSELGPGDTPQDAGEPPATRMGTGGSPDHPVGPGGSPSLPIGTGGTPGVPPNTGGYGPGGIGGNPNPGATPETNALCAEWGYYDSTVLTEDLFRGKIVGQWMLCGTTSIFGTGEAGLEIAGDGTWYKLVGNAGAATRATEPTEHGTWEVIDTSSMNSPGWFQLNLDNSIGTVIVSPRFTSSPVKMAVSNNGVFDAVYVLPNQPFEPRLDETFAADFPPSACGQPEPTPDFTESLSEFQSWITGRWLSCGSSAFGSTDDVGIDITSDGKFRRLSLLPGTNAIVVVGHGFDREGTWELTDTSEMNGPGSFYLGLYIAGRGFTGNFPHATASPRTLAFPGVGRYVVAP